MAFIDSAKEVFCLQLKRITDGQTDGEAISITGRLIGNAR